MAIPYSGGFLNFSSAYLGAFSDLENDYNLPISSNNLSDTDKKNLEKSLDIAKSTGDKRWEQVLQYVLKYGPAVLGILVSTGVIKNKNLSSVTAGDIDSGKVDDLTQLGKQYRNANNGSGDSGNSGFKIFGIEINATTLLIGIVILILLYNMFQQSNNNKKK